MQEFWTKEYGEETGLGRGEKNHPKADIDFKNKIQETSNGTDDQIHEGSLMRRK
jgi:hypothetical protein